METKCLTARSTGGIVRELVTTDRETYLVSELSPLLVLESSSFVVERKAPVEAVAAVPSPWSKKA